MSANNFLVFICLSIFISISVWSMYPNSQTNLTYPYLCYFPSQIGTPPNYFDQSQMGISIDNSNLQLNSNYLNQNQVHSSPLDDDSKCFILEIGEEKILLANKQKNTSINNIQMPNLSKEQIAELLEMLKKRKSDELLCMTTIGELLASATYNAVKNDEEDFCNLTIIAEYLIVKVGALPPGEKAIYLLETVLSNLLRIADELKEPLKDILIDSRAKKSKDKILVLHNQCNSKKKYKALLDAAQRYGFYIKQIEKKGGKDTYIAYEKNDNYTDLLASKVNDQNRCLMENNKYNNDNSYEKISPKKSSKLKLAYQYQYLDSNPSSEYVFSDEEKEQIGKLISKNQLINNDLNNLNLWINSKLNEKDLPFLMNLLDNFVSRPSFFNYIKEDNHVGIIHLLNGVPFNIVNIVNLSGEPLKHAERLGKSKNEILEEYKKEGDYQIILNVLKSYKFFVKFHSKRASIVYDPNNNSESCFIFDENEKIILVDNPHRQYFLPEYDSEYKVSAKEIKDVFEKAQFCNKDLEILKL